MSAINEYIQAPSNNRKISTHFCIRLSYTTNIAIWWMRVPDSWASHRSSWNHASGHSAWLRFIIHRTCHHPDERYGHFIFRGKYIRPFIIFISNESFTGHHIRIFRWIPSGLDTPWNQRWFSFQRLSQQSCEEIEWSADHPVHEIHHDPFYPHSENCFSAHPSACHGQCGVQRTSPIFFSFAYQ